MADEYTPWKEEFVFVPRRTISGKWKAGKIYKREMRGDWTDFSVPGPVIETQYATEKEKFISELKGD